ncbi:MAG: ESPR domain-containing protein [Neisseriaceae bacterium]|nr:ESPR domain-containing protein [Neisseriaceae bacterium]
MNKKYRVIFNQQRGAFMVVAEDTHARGKSSCKSSVSSVVGEVALCAVVAATAIGAGLMPTTAAADTWSVTSGTQYTNTTSSTNGTYDNNFFRPGKAPTYAGSAGFFDKYGATEAVQIVTGNHANTPTWFNSAVNLGADNDATNLTRMQDALDIIQRSNELRAEEARIENKTIPELKITHAAMAMAQIAVDKATFATEQHLLL